MAAGDRLSGESAPAWQAFTRYRDLGPGTRSVQRVAQELSKSATLIKRWSARWRWVERAAEHDAERDRIARESTADAVRGVREEQLRVAGLMLARAREAIEEVPPLRSADVPRWVNVGVKVERLAMGVATTVEQRIADPEEHVRITRAQAEALARVIRGVLNDLGIYDRPEVPGIVRRHLLLVADLEE